MIFHLEQLAAKPQGEIEDSPYDRWLSVEGQDVALFYRTDQSFLVRFQDKADFELSVGRGVVTCTPAPDVSGQTTIDLFHNQVIPLLLNHQGELVLHGSAVAGSTGALGFIGQSGSGKSTIAAYFAKAGHPFMTDDGLFLKEAGSAYNVEPYRPYLRLWSDSNQAVLGRKPPTAEEGEDNKTLIDAGPSLPFQETPLPLAALYLLGSREVEKVSVERMKPDLALLALLKHSFILDVDDRQRLKAHFERLAKLSEAILCFTLEYPRDYGVFPELIPTVLNHASSEGVL